ncbi:hypothetical protein D7D52_35845 [Nocardia yunnanensis]|uniref:Uncharacterized protein n=1 Tax=Nocardia yunnanensis TaxID=2382165 RepID=A0A386ZLX8_9NOCA|nr:hypothetical protein [Nocardia yunnanensis]AYF78313.1 hypothetical protein D7D52_35845 [Nocardia yunnanensis]
MTSTDTPDLPQDQILVWVSCGEGTVSVTGRLVARHFAVTPKLTADGTIRPFGLNLIHVPTGLRIPALGFPCRDQLRELAEKLAMLPIDWAAAEPGTFGPNKRQLIDQTMDSWERGRRHHVCKTEADKGGEQR